MLMAKPCCERVTPWDSGTRAWLILLRVVFDQRQKAVDGVYEFAVRSGDKKCGYECQVQNEQTSQRRRGAECQREQARVRAVRPRMPRKS